MRRSFISIAPGLLALAFPCLAQDRAIGNPSTREEWQSRYNATRERLEQRREELRREREERLGPKREQSRLDREQRIEPRQEELKRDREKRLGTRQEEI